MDIARQAVGGARIQFSWADKLQSDNQIVQGRWWKHGEKGESGAFVEEDIAKTVGIGWAIS